MIACDNTGHCHMMSDGLALETPNPSWPNRVMELPRMVQNSMTPDMGVCNPLVKFCADRSSILSSLTGWLATHPDDADAVAELNGTIAALRQVHALMTGRLTLQDIAA